MKNIIAILILVVIAIIIGMYKPKEKVSVPVPQMQTLCYTRKSDSRDEYKVEEYMKLTFDGATVTGIKRGTQVGPDMQNGYEGTIEGTKDENVINVVFSYVVEGASQKEEERYELSDSSITKYRYPLIENNSLLVPDRNKAVELQEYSLISCEEFDNNLNKQMI